MHASGFDLLRDLRLALERNELELFYQPKIDAVSGKVTDGRSAAALATSDTRYGAAYRSSFRLLSASG